MPRLLHACLLLLLSATFAPASAQKGEEVALFKRYYSGARSAAERREAVLTLEHLDDARVFGALYPRLADEQLEPEVAEAIVRVFAGFPAEAQRKQVFEALEAEKAEPAKLALLQAIAQGRWKDSLGLLPRQLGERSWEVRRYALEALAAGGDASAAGTIAPLCEDGKDAVRFKALDALAQFDSPLVVAKAIERLDDPSRQVRHSAIRALARVRSKSSVAPLVARLQKEEGLLAPLIVDTLGGLTGLDLGPEPAQWARWWAEQKPESYDIPSVAAVAYLREHRAARSGGNGWDGPDTHPGPHVFPLRGPSRRMIFVIDCSGSMESLVTERERFAGQDYPDFSRMEIVKAELAREIESLPAYARFNIVAFATEVMPWKPSLQQANVLVKLAAKDWVKRLQAIGGPSKADLAAAGLGRSSNVELGRTNTFDALRIALGVQDLRTADETAEKVEADTIFFLSDGRPTAGPFVDTDDILREIRKLNELRKVVIHAIGIGEFDQQFMRRLAQENGPGVFVDLGK